MNRNTVLLFFLLNISSIIWAQVGIDTAYPTNDLDINGELRIRDIPINTDPSQIVLTADSEGNVGSKRFTLNDAEMIVATNPVTHTLTSNVETIVDNIDLGLSIVATVPAGKSAFIKIYYSVPIAAPTGNNDDDENGTRYYGISFLRNNIVQPSANRVFRATDFENGDNISAVSHIYTETYDNSGNTSDKTITYSLNGYAKQVPQTGETLTEDNVFIFNMPSGSTDITGSYGIANLNKQVFIIPN